MDREKLNIKEQRVLKKLDKGYHMFSKMVILGTYLLAAYMLVMSLYYRTGKFSGGLGKGRASDYFGGFLIFAGAGAFVTLLYIILGAVNQREFRFDPREMVLPLKGTVTLETALHRMALKTGVIYWDTVFGLLLGILLLMKVFLGGNISRILLSCFILGFLLVGGHLFWSWRWKKRSFTDKMLHNMKSFLVIEDSAGYAAEVEMSLLNGVLYYGRELILTGEYIIGVITELNAGFTPVAVPRAEISCLVFFSKRPVMNRYRNYESGILDCRLASGKSVELIVGHGARALRAIKVLNYYQIEWKIEAAVYE